MPIRDNDPRPAYQQLADELRQAITSGQYQPGDRLPSTRELSETHGIAAMTVRNAVQVLEDERLVVARQGRGVFVNTPEPTRAADPLDGVLERLDDTMKLLARIEQRLDRDQGRSAAADAVDAAGAAGADADPAVAPERDTGVEDNLAAAERNLAAVRDALAARTAAQPHDPYIDLAPDHGPDAGIDM